ncbi:helix-turn-helix transcriptional regulator [Phenylobacterium sp. VNQ135]|uniref:helix-turn-helix transcriptional regulator n=1 Tax=Phenylobacterium sp. VNQ135 TaxID=3400922 RepID=UPI003C06FCDB
MDASRVPNRYMRTPEAGRYLSLSGRTLEKHRTYGTGPRYRKIGGRVVYAVSDLEAWADQGAQTSTTDPDGGRVRAARRHEAESQAQSA